MRRVRVADGRGWHLLRAHAVHFAAVSAALMTASLFYRWLGGVRFGETDLLFAFLFAILPGLIGLCVGYAFRHRLAVVGAIGVAFLLRLLSLGLFVAGPVSAGRTGPFGRAFAVLLLAGLLAGLSAEGAMIARPPPRPD